MTNNPLSSVDPLGLRLCSPGDDFSFCYGSGGFGPGGGGGGGFGGLWLFYTPGYFQTYGRPDDVSTEWVDPTWTFVPVGSASNGGPYVTPGAAAARQIIIKILSQTNSCSAYFNGSAADFTEGANPSAADIFSAVDLRLNPTRPTVGAQSFQGAGASAPIFINPNGPFFLSIPGTPTYSIGPFAGGTPEAQVTILFHELAHTIDAIPSDAGNVPLSEDNTKVVLQHCQQQINSVAH